MHYARSLKTVAEDLQRVHATILLGVPLLYDKMYKRITAALAGTVQEHDQRPAALRITPVIGGQI